MIKKFFALAIFIGLFSLASYMEHNYSIEATVINETTIEDITGNKWKVDYIPYRNGSIVKVFFNDNYTMDKREDDIIKKISLKY